MPKVEKLSITLPPKMAAWVRNAVESGEFANASEVICDALLIWKQKRELAHARLIATLKQGLKESAEGKSVYRGSFAKYAKE
jgi:putative addiction module CopG family antidote